MSAKISPLRWGVDSAGSVEHIERKPWVRELLDEFGFDLWMDHLSPQPRVADTADKLRGLDQFAGEHGIRWMSNVEHANFAKGFKDDQEREWYHKPDGRYYFQFPPELLELLGSCRHLQGLMYDEAEHMQNCANSIGHANKPWLYAPAPGTPLSAAAEGFEAAAAEMAALHARYGIQLYTEHVFPVLFHSFNRAGWTAGSKGLKENYTPAFIACALGAAKQYGRELWLTPDFWWMFDCPGHTPDEYRSALLMAYHMGADCIYTENLAWYREERYPSWGPTLIEADEGGYRTAPLGEVARWFRKEYINTHPRSYTFEEVQPRVVIIRQEDACWGQAFSWLPDTLFGSSMWPSTRTTEAWLRLWHLLSRGVISATKLSWNATFAAAEERFRFFCPLDGVVVYDHRVQTPLLEGVEVIFLTGIGILPETQQAAADCVRSGALCVSLPHLAPERVRRTTGEDGELADGAGKWLVTPDFLAPGVRKAVRHILPPYDTMRYRFGNTEVRFRMLDDDPSRIEVELS
ncbi:MAG: hypothetical protein GXY52_00360 [Chloroflexi bacterium]|nr:hypothetical protein [Chloroflexota bacterium]